MLDGEEEVYAGNAFVPSRFSLNMVTVGSRVPLAPTAVGSAILALLDAPERDAILDRLGFAAYTPNTKVAQPALEALLGTVRAIGFCLSEAEHVEGFSSLAVPVFGQSGRVADALSIIFPQGKYTTRDPGDAISVRQKRCATDMR